MHNFANDHFDLQHNSSTPAQTTTLAGSNNSWGGNWTGTKLSLLIFSILSVVALSFNTILILLFHFFLFNGTFSACLGLNRVSILHIFMIRLMAFKMERMQKNNLFQVRLHLPLVRQTDHSYSKTHQCFCYAWLVESDLWNKLFLWTSLLFSKWTTWPV